MHRTLRVAKGVTWVDKVGPVRSSRPYHSPHRARGAAETRATILESAHRLFLRHGYGRVTVAQIAAEAGIAAKTVYASVGSKGDILNELTDSAVAESDADEVIARVRATGTGREALAELARGTRAGNERGQESLTILRHALAAHEGADALWERASAAYRSALRGAALHLDAIGALPPDIDVDRAADLMWLWFGPDAWRALVETCGWSWDEAETWLLRNALSVLT